MRKYLSTKRFSWLDVASFLVAYELVSGALDVIAKHWP